MYSQELIEAAKNTNRNLRSRTKKLFPASVILLDLIKEQEPFLLEEGRSLTAARRLILNGIGPVYCKFCKKDVSDDPRLPPYCSMKCYKADPAAGNTISKIKKELYSDPEWKASVELKKMETNIKNLGVPHSLQNVDVFERQKKACFKKKEHKGMNLQGFEPQAYDYLEMFDYDVEQGTDFIKREGSITYLDETGKERHCFPDFYCHDLNSFIEVKSTYTYEQAIDGQIKNAIKATADMQKGYIIMIITPSKSIAFQYYNKRFISQ